MTAVFDTTFILIKDFDTVPSAEVRKLWSDVFKALRDDAVWEDYKS